MPEQIGTLYVTDRTEASMVREVPCFWRRDGLAITTHLGDRSAFVITHVNTGSNIGRSTRNFDMLKAVAERVLPLAPWATMGLDDMARSIHSECRPQWALDVGVTMRGMWRDDPEM